MPQQLPSSTADYHVIVLGAGHAGCESALACARMGYKTLCLTISPDAVALMACNPSIGGTSKGHLVREIDALGGEMGLAADECFIQMRMLNTGKGVAVHSLRAQMDKHRYHERMKLTLESQENLYLKQGECVKILTEGSKVSGIFCKDGTKYTCSALIVACGVYLSSRILIGEHAENSGPCGLLNANELGGALMELGLTLRRFKTGTPPRIDKKTIDFSKMAVQPGDIPIPRFSFMSDQSNREQTPCYLTYTNSQTHEIIQRNIHRSPTYNGLVSATGARYCPSIEDKIVRFAGKERHQIFIEPEGLSTNEMYVQGLSTGLPLDVQLEMLRSIEGLEDCEIIRPGYAIEYDCIDPTVLTASLGHSLIDGLYFAGQINGSSGYEEAAAQGLMAGINASLFLRNEPPLILTRAQAYIGVLCDDLTTKGTDEPYRMMTSRAEYRLLLRQDNADMRLTELARRTGLISKRRYEHLLRKRDELSQCLKSLDAFVPPSESLEHLFTQKGSHPPSTGVRLYDLLKRGDISYCELHSLYANILPDISAEAAEQAEIQARYEGYIQKQEAQVEAFLKLESIALPENIDYNSIHGLRIEARQKLSAQLPESLGQASRIPGVSPSDISVLMIKLKALGVM